MYEASPETFSNILIEIIANDVKDLVDFINSKQMEGFCPSEALIPLGKQRPQSNRICTHIALRK